MKTWMWIVLGVIVLGVIAYAMYVSAQIRRAKLEAEQQQQMMNQLGGEYKPRTSKLAEILDALTPFISLFGSSGSGSGNNTPVQCNPDRPGYDVNGFPRPECGFGG